MSQGDVDFLDPGRGNGSDGKDKVGTPSQLTAPAGHADGADAKFLGAVDGLDHIA